MFPPWILNSSLELTPKLTRFILSYFLKFYFLKKIKKTKFLFLLKIKEFLFYLVNSSCLIKLYQNNSFFIIFEI
jgi:hypothetical protein